MGKGRTCTQFDVKKAMDQIEDLPSQKAERFDAVGNDADGSESLHDSMHDDEFTLIEIKRFLDSHGFTTTMDELRRLRRLASNLDANSDQES